MKYLHIILPSKRMMETYIKMIREYYPIENHTFYFLGKCPESEQCLFDYENIIMLDEGKSKLDKIKNFYFDLKKYDYIFWHGLILSPKFAVFLFFMRKFLKKSIWVMWGIDLYEWKKNEANMKDKLINIINKNIRDNIKKIVAIFPTDIDMYKKIFNDEKKNIYYAPYPIRKNVFLSLENKNLKNKRLNGEIWIQIGNNANSFNRHLEILETLKKYNKENIRIFIPMSYGNDWHNEIKNYKEFVEKKAIEYFGKERVNILLNLMTIEEYSKYLEQIDIIIIATNRQNALGNILKGMYGGATVYLSEQNILYKYFNKNNINIKKFEDISYLSFDEFIKKESNKNLKKFMIENYYPSMNIKYWNNIFKDIEKEFSTKKEITNVLSEDILNDIRKHAFFREYANYINLYKYTCKNKKNINKINELDELVFVGTDNSVIKILNYIFEANKEKYRWHVVGIIDYEMKDIKNVAFEYNTIATIKNFISNEKTKYIIANEDGKVRENYLNTLRHEIEKIGFIKGENSYIGSNFKYEIGFFIGNNSLVNFNCKVGKLIKIGNNTIIGSNCILGNFVTIGDNCIIEDYVIINDYTYIPSGTIIRRTK